MSAVQRALRGVGALALVSTVTACGLTSHKAPVNPPGGAIFAHVKAPLTANYDGNAAGAATMKTSSSQTKFLNVPIAGQWSFSWDDAAIGQIASSAGMTSVAYADYEVMNILGIWQTFTVHVYGN